jgi:hypothetical protein
MEWVSLRDIAETGSRYQFDSLPHLIVGAAVKVLRSGPDGQCYAFQIFEFASQHDLPDLAKYAIAFFASTTFVAARDAARVSCPTFSNIPGNYTAALLKAMALHPIPSYHAKINWGAVAGSFDVDL